MAEELFSHPSGIIVTRGRVQLPAVIVDGRVVAEAHTYSLANITSVSMQTIPPSTGCLTLATVFFALGAVGSIPNYLNNEIAGAGPGIIGGGLVSAGIAYACHATAKGRKAHYVVLFRTAGVEDRALATQDRSVATSLVEAVNQAMELRSA